jgi:hypothetical protein
VDARNLSTPNAVAQQNLTAELRRSIFREQTSVYGANQPSTARLPPNRQCHRLTTCEQLPTAVVGQIRHAQSCGFRLKA